MGEFEDRIQQAALRYYQANAAKEDADASLGKKRADFLVAFDQTVRGDIRSVLLSAQETFQAGLPGTLPARAKVGLELSEPVGQNSISLTLRRGDRAYTLRFVADPIAMRVKVSMDTLDGGSDVDMGAMALEHIDQNYLKQTVARAIDDWLRY